eukprot:6172995-Pleurochrysis_carterae.AAC.4
MNSTGETLSPSKAAQLKRRRTCRDNLWKELIASTSEDEQEVGEESRACVGSGVAAPFAPHQRRGVYRPQPRNGDLDSIVPLERWRYRNSGCQWWKLSDSKYVEEVDTYEGLKFREHFRVPYKIFKELHQEALQSGYFLPAKVPEDGKRGTYSQPLTLKLLAGLRWLATGCDFKSLALQAFLGVNTIRKFIAKWLTFPSAVPYSTWVKPPTDDEALNHASTRELAY